jgi:hypothetical protein
MSTVEGPAAAPRIDRVVSSETRDALARLEGADVLRAGGANLIGLDAIRSKLGDRWPAKRSRVWEHVERDLEKRLAPTDMVLRLDEVNFLVAISGASRFAAQATCLHALKDVLQFFLGETRMTDIAVCAVSSVEGGVVTSAPLDPAAIEREAAAPTVHDRALSDQAAEEWRPPLAGRTHLSNFFGVKRHPIEVRIAVEPVVNLRRDLVTSFLIDRDAVPGVTDPGDRLQVDAAVLTYAVSLLQEHKARGGKLTLHLPVSYSSIASVKAREATLRMMRHMQSIARETALIEIDDLDAGIPPSRLLEVVSLIKPFCLGVLGRVRPTRKALDAVKGCGLKGLVLDADGGIGRTPAEDAIILRAFVEAGGVIAPNLIVHGLADPVMVDIAKAAGLTHASLEPDLRTTALQVDAA